VEIQDQDKGVMVGEIAIATVVAIIKTITEAADGNIIPTTTSPGTITVTVGARKRQNQDPDQDLLSSKEEEGRKVFQDQGLVPREGTEVPLLAKTEAVAEAMIVRDEFKERRVFHDQDQDLELIDGDENWNKKYKDYLMSNRVW